MDIEEFYEQDPRRQASDEIEFGRDWYEHDLRFEVAWVAETGGWQDAMLQPESLAWVRARVAGVDSGT